jgi:hypothetical protein
MGEDEGGGGQKNLVPPSPSSPPTRGGEVLEKFILKMLEENSQITHITI